MLRLVRFAGVLLFVGMSSPAFACYTDSGLGIQLGTVFLGVSKRNAPCVLLAQASPVIYSPPPVVYAPPQPVVYVAPPVVVAQPGPVKDGRPGMFAIKYMPGASSTLYLGPDSLEVGRIGFAHSLGLELRLTRWLSLRSDLEFRRRSRTWDIMGIKLSLFPHSPVKPYASVSFAGNENYSNKGQYSFGFAGAGGLDVFLGKTFFLEAEVRYRMTPSSCCVDAPALTGLVGGGVAFF